MAVEVRYVRNEEDGWDPAVKRKKSAGCVGDGELRVDRSAMYFRNLNGIPGTNIPDGGGGRGIRHSVAVKPSQVTSRTKTKFKYIKTR